MLEMAKKNKKEKETIRHEKQISMRLFGTDLAVYQANNTKPKDVFRSGLYDENRKKKSPQQIKLLSEIFVVNNRIMENELKVRADKLLLNELRKEYNNIIGFNESKRNQLIKAIKKEYYDFIEDEKYADCDLSDFYTIRRDAISISAMRVGIEYEDAIDVFDSYLEDEVAKQSILENTRTSEFEDV